MAMTFEDLVKVNKTLNTTPIKNKEYVEVNQRIKAFRMLYPEGCIKTEMLSNDGETCVFKAEILVDGKLLGTGTAFENKGSSFINKTSYIENCETSAVGRALAMCGIGIDVSIASAEEVGNAVANQNENTITYREAEILEAMCKKANVDIPAFLSKKGKTSFKEFTTEEYNKTVRCLHKRIDELNGNNSES